MTTGKGTLVGVRILDDPLAKLDAWIVEQGGTMTRPEAIRRLVEIALTVRGGANEIAVKQESPFKQNDRPNAEVK